MPETQDQGKKWLTRLAVWALILLFLLLSFPFFMMGITIFVTRIREAVPVFSFGGGIQCKTWEDAGDLQGIFEKAANKYGIQPALLGAIFLAENGGSWKDKNTSWPVSPSYARGPFQFIDSTWWNESRKTGYAKDGDGDGQKDVNNIYDAAEGAASYLSDILTKDVHTQSDTIDEKNIRSAAVAYNKGSRNMQKWRKLGWWFDLIPNVEAKNYQENAARYFKMLNEGCSSVLAGNYSSCDGTETSTVSAGKKIVVVDPGHGSGGNAGASSKYGKERDYTLKIGLALKPKLESLGYTVVMTRTGEQALASSQTADNIKRAEKANDAGASLSFRIHMDGDFADMEGYKIMYPDKQGTVYKNDKKENGIQKVGPSNNVILDSAKISNIINRVFGASMRGVKDGKGNELFKKLSTDGLLPESEASGNAVIDRQGALTGSIYSEVPVSLIELGAIGNRATVDYLNTAAGMDKVASALTEAISAAVPPGSPAPNNAILTRNCAVANLAIKTASDVANEQPRSNNMLVKVSQYAKTLKTWLTYSACSHFVAYVMKQSGADPSFPYGSVNGAEFPYILTSGKYDLFPRPANLNDLRPGDLLIRGRCSAPNNCIASSSQSGHGHIEIWVGPNKTFPNARIISASYGDRGPMPRGVAPSSTMGIVARLKN